MHTKRELPRHRKRALVERGAGDVPVEPWPVKQMADRHVVASGEDERHRDKTE